MGATNQYPLLFKTLRCVSFVNFVPQIQNSDVAPATLGSRRHFIQSTEITQQSEHNMYSQKMYSRILKPKADTCMYFPEYIHFSKVT